MAAHTPHLLMDISPSRTLSNPPLSPKPSDTSPSTLHPSQQPNLTKISLRSQLSSGMQTAQEWREEQLLRAQLLRDLVRDINKKERSQEGPFSMTHDMSTISDYALTDAGQWSTTMDRIPLHLRRYQRRSHPYRRDLDRDIALRPDTPATGAADTSTRDARAVSRAARRIALVEASEVREARKPKSAAQKQQQPAVTCYREDPRRASEMATPQSPEVTEAPIMPEVAAGRRAEPLQRQPEVIDLTGED